MQVDAQAVYAAQNILESQFPGITSRAKDSFSLVANFLPATANTTTPQNVIVSQDADFVWVGTTFNAFNTDNLTIVSNPSFLVQYTDQSTGRALMSQAAPVTCVAGLNGEDYLLKWPQILLRGTTLQVSVTNLDPANNRNVRITLNGFKVYGQPLLNTRR